jgi:acetolactate decarboxylase
VPAVPLDEKLIGALHVQSLPEAEISDGQGESGIFQASTIASLLDGNYEGDVSFAELEGHGDIGLGTLNGCDGEMLALDGRFLRADAEGDIHEVPPDAHTPFAVLAHFRPAHRFELNDIASEDELGAAIDSEVGHPEQVHALRIEGRFARVHARSVPKQEPPYRPLAEVVADQRVFDFSDVEGTVVGFRFPDVEEGLNVPGYHLHFVTADRRRGGHVLDCALRRGTVEVDDSVEVHLELPAGVELGGPDDPDAVRGVEREG